MRSVLVLVALLLPFAAATSRAADEEKATWLFVVTGEVRAASATELTIAADPTVIAFTDRPERRVRTVSVDTLVDDIWTSGADSFAADPPNAAIVAGDDRVEIDTLKSVERDGKMITFATADLAGSPPDAGARVFVVIDGFIY